MKVVQVGILIALLVVAALLFKVYQQQSAAPQVEPQAATAQAPPATPAPPAETAPPATAPAAETPVPPAAQPAAAPETAPRPAPARARGRAATPRERPQPTETASAVPAPEPPSSPAPPPQAPPPQTPAPPEAPAPPATAPLNPPSGTPTAPREPQRVTIPAGTLLAVRLSETLSTDRQSAGDSFSATLDQALVIEGFVIAERGARLEGRVLEAQKAGRVRGTATLAIHLIRLRTSDGQDVPIETAKFVKEGESSRREDATKVGAGAAIGAAIGAIAGGGRGAAIGAGVGGGAGAGTVAATRGKPAVLPSETRISFRLQAPVQLTERIP